MHKLLLLSLGFPLAFHVSYVLIGGLHPFHLAILGAMAFSWVALTLLGIEFRPFPSSGVIPRKVLIKIPILGLLLGYFVGQNPYWHDKAYLLPLMGMLLSLYFLYGNRMLYRLARRHLYYSFCCFVIFCLFNGGSYSADGTWSWIAGCFLIGHYYFLNKLFNGFWIRHHIVKSS